VGKFLPVQNPHPRARVDKPVRVFFSSSHCDTLPSTPAGTSASQPSGPFPSDPSSVVHAVSFTFTMRSTSSSSEVPQVGTLGSDRQQRPDSCVPIWSDWSSPSCGPSVPTPRRVPYECDLLGCSVMHRCVRPSSHCKYDTVSQLPVCAMHR
jgi:hypothetical protein